MGIYLKKIDVNQCFWLCDITKHRIYKIDPILANFKDRDSWFSPEYFIIWGHQVHFGHVTGYKLFYIRKLPTPLKWFVNVYC